jgi:5-oxoprolinase (ATP-hydrolysing) subunit C
MALTVLSCGLGTSLQDAGRFGLQRYGVGTSGAFNRLDLRALHALLGVNTAIEFLMMGGVFSYHGAPRLVALAGDATLHINDQLIPPLTCALINDGVMLRVGVARSGNSMMLGVAGGFDLPLDLGSHSFHLRGGLGIYLKAGDILALNASENRELCNLQPYKEETGAFRVVLGPQDDYFAQDVIEQFLTSPFTISNEADRMGFRLTGAKLTSDKGHNIVTDGVATGSIQVPGSGEPIILMVDRQTTGGYPKIATVISSDLTRLAKHRPGDTLHFKAVSQEEAINIARLHERNMTAWLSSKQPLKRELTSEFLLSVELNDEVYKDLVG